MPGRNNGPFTESFSPVSGEHSGNGKENDSKKKKIYLVETAAGLRRAFLPFPESTPETGQIFCVKKRKIFCVKKRKNYRVELRTGRPWHGSQERQIIGPFPESSPETGRKIAIMHQMGKKSIRLAFFAMQFSLSRLSIIHRDFFPQVALICPMYLLLSQKNSQLLEKQLSTKLAHKSQH